MCEGVPYYYECQGCLEMITDDIGNFPDTCSECNSAKDKWKLVYYEENS